jgi:hypothetical protein
MPSDSHNHIFKKCRHAQPFVHLTATPLRTVSTLPLSTPLTLVFFAPGTYNMVEHIFGEIICKEASRCIRKTPTPARATTLKSIIFWRREAKGGGAFRRRELSYRKAIARMGILDKSPLLFDPTKKVGFAYRNHPSFSIFVLFSAGHLLYAHLFVRSS